MLPDLLRLVRRALVPPPAAARKGLMGFINKGPQARRPDTIILCTGTPPQPKGPLLVRSRL